MTMPMTDVHESGYESAHESADERALKRAHARMREQTRGYVDAVRAAYELPDDTIATQKRRIEELEREIAGLKRRLTAAPSVLDSGEPGKGHRIARAVARAHRLPLADLVSEKRQKELVLARHHAIYLMCAHTHLSLAGIGRILGGRDHTTIQSGRSAHEARLASGMTFPPLEVAEV